MDRSSLAKIGMDCLEEAVLADLEGKNKVKMSHKIARSLKLYEDGKGGRVRQQAANRIILNILESLERDGRVEPNNPGYNPRWWKLTERERLRRRA